MGADADTATGGVRVGDLVDIYDAPFGNVVGTGTYQGEVNLHAMVAPETGMLVVSEEPFAEEATKGMAVLADIIGNPKIKLEDGRVVYGCQVWWQPRTPEVQDAVPHWRGAVEWPKGDGREER